LRLELILVFIFNYFFFIFKNLGKNKETIEAIHDFEIGIHHVSQYCDYLVINISSPNTPGLRQYQAKNELIKVLNFFK
jgi:dihydroorotate dehydrogenase